MKRLIMTRGLPASGKSTWALQQLHDKPGAFKRVNKDDIRASVDGGKWSRDNEKFVLGIRDYIITAALDAGKHVIVDDTNLADKHELRLRELASRNGAQFEIQDFTHVGVEECIERDRKRPNYVGEKVISDMHKQFLMKPVTPAPIDPALPWCVICDIDGTVALMNGRGPYEGEKCDTDVPNVRVLDLVQQLMSDPRRQDEILIFVSGRFEAVRFKTKEWLKRYLGYWEPLFMRPDGDMREDSIIKREIYEREIMGKYNCRFVVDDRSRVVKMWRSLGLTCLQVADGDF